jgi:LacI family transcriptional regulator
MGTMADVAKAAGVSVSTVSHVLNETRPVNADTRQRVLDAVAATDYRRNALATALVTSRTHSIGVGISAVQNPYFANLVHAIEKRASAHGYTLMMGDSRDDADLESGLFESFLDRRVDGLILAPAPGAESVSLPRVVASGTPFVLVDRHIPDLHCDQLAPENVGPVKTITRHLIDLGHQRIAVMAGSPGLQSSTERLEGYLLAMESAGLKPDPSLRGQGNSNQDDAYAETIRIFGCEESRPTGVVVLNNAMTIGTLRGLKSLTLRVPDDVALVCYDDFEWADLFEPQLTAIEQDIESMGSRAFDFLLNRIEGSTAAPEIVRIATKYRHRNSCGCK